MSTEELMFLNCGVREDSWKSLGLRDQTSQSKRKSVLNIRWKDWYWGWNSIILWPLDVKNWLTGKDPDAGKDWRQRRREDRGWDGRMASLTWWTRVWTHSRSWWWTGQPGRLQSMGSQSWTQPSDWTKLMYMYIHSFHINFHYYLSQDIEYSSLCYTVGPCC